MSGGLFGAPLPEAVSIDRQIRAAKRELSMRAHKYPQWVSAGRMKQAEADEEIAAMRAIVDTLQRVKESGDELARCEVSRVRRRAGRVLCRRETHPVGREDDLDDVAAH